MSEPLDLSEPKLPTIKVSWDAENQVAHLNFDRTQFKTFNFLKAVLQMALDVAEAEERKAQVLAMQRRFLESQQIEALKRSIRH